MRRRMVGRLDWGGGPAPACWSVNFPPAPQMLEEGELAQERVVVQASTYLAQLLAELDRSR